MNWSIAEPFTATKRKHNSELLRKEMEIHLLLGQMKEGDGMDRWVENK